ncbi:unnamed protein product [Adineta steineri]|uniref:Uncharacterized protein n=1 Tax=Adineta steineri TaxID=433720 RepID=A0A819NXI7_9BILA|nr:unnamed protein product [Adineta steineri]CAF1488928.1 unnamed protein product [Adineta steineri]CAF4003739.1 unnamed protein product [Adineta steineri]CAF4173028.1 unnamed protein product [Adineta steineri]
MKHQSGSEYTFSPSDNFNYVPGLNQAFYVTQNTLFKIIFQGTLYNSGFVDTPIFLQVMVNDHLIIGNKILPNTGDRVNYGISDVDEKNGYFSVGYLHQVWIATPMTKSAQVYLSPGIYSFNVGAKALNHNGYIYGSTVTYELLQFENGNLQTIGGFLLITTLAK